MEDESEMLIRNAKNKWEKSKIVQKMRAARYYVKPNVMRRRELSSSLYLQRRKSLEDV